MKSFEERFWSKVSIYSGLNGCWQWTGARFPKGGYGCFWLEGSNARAHRVSYELAYGPIPEGLELDHLCKNTACVNPLHLEAVTTAENARRKRLSHCRRGHPFDEFNTLIEGRNRKCRTCWNAAQRQRRARKREVLATTAERD